jgi:23S rRNA (pseudouridine1915-N3)-methyltransferase
MKSIKLIFVGQLKASFFREASAHYVGALKRYFPVEEVIVKDAGQARDREKRLRIEGDAILSKLGPRDMLAALDEHGNQLSSPEFAERLGKWEEDPGLAPCFVVGGAYGLSREVLAASRFTLSLGRCTLPHELARVVLLEQLYRAASILRGSPYHHQ